MDISVILPSYNEEKYIEPCLKALSEQDYKGNYEIIVSDATSTDRTIEIAEKYADKVVVDKKCTISYGREMGARASKYPLLAYTDSDTLAAKDWLTKISKNFDDEKTVGVHGKILPSDGNRVEWGFSKYAIPPYSHFMIAINKPAIPGSNFAMRRWAWEKAGGFDVSLVTGEDVNMGARIKKYGKFRYDPKAIVYVSTRRVRKWGYAKMLSYYAIETVRLQFFGKASEDYEVVR